MFIEKTYQHYNNGPGRPQILLLGNGIERYSGQVNWEKFLSQIQVPNCPSIPKKSLIPFPLQYEILSTPSPAPNFFSPKHEELRKTHLEDGLNLLCDSSNDLLDLLPSLNLDHILTTNYTYCTEAAFGAKVSPTKYLQEDMQVKQFVCSKLSKPGSAVSPEKSYRLRTGYLLPRKDGGETAIWHIHGEKSNDSTIVLGHEKYGKVLAKITECCTDSALKRISEMRKETDFYNWPELFLFGDIYILGFGYNMCESDLWWLLRRKQRQANTDGKVFFYEPSHPRSDSNWQSKKLLLETCGVNIRDLGMSTADTDKENEDDFYRSFYKDAIFDISSEIHENRASSIAASSYCGDNIMI